MLIKKTKAKQKMEFKGRYTNENEPINDERS